jgi:hypothetical protein
MIFCVRPCLLMGLFFSRNDGRYLIELVSVSSLGRVLPSMGRVSPLLVLCLRQCHEQHMLVSGQAPLSPSFAMTLLSMTISSCNYCNPKRLRTCLVESLILSLSIVASTRALRTSLFKSFVVSVALFCAQ